MKREILSRLTTKIDIKYFRRVYFKKIFWKFDFKLCISTSTNRPIFLIYFY